MTTKRIGIGKPGVAVTYSSPPTDIDWYDIELTQVEDRVVAKCLNLQGAVSDGKDEGEAMDNIIIAINGIQNVRRRV